MKAPVTDGSLGASAWQLVVYPTRGVIRAVHVKPSADACRALATKLRKDGEVVDQEIVFDIYSPSGVVHMHSLPNTGWRMVWKDGRRPL